ncbi:gp257 [Sphingomonas phage PAU]|uniref:gp257 n=1 Tax=Sphingomonas phage PAU TaxID=1150991 RepID=UPI0002573407|nr:gp257 [Sphingomonas phage PAU]AFF28255.1 gp257 [Sphingomonas phage PAU]
MKTQKLLISLVLFITTLTTFAQNDLKVRTRSADGYLQTDYFLNVPKRLTIPSGPTETLNSSLIDTTKQASLFFNTTTKKLRAFDPVGMSWADVVAGGSDSPIKLNNSTIYDSRTSNYSNNNSIFLGDMAGRNATNANNSIILGYYSGNNATNSRNSVFIGNSTGNGATAANESVFLGSYAGDGATGAHSSIMLGENAGYNATGASMSILLGKQAGKGFTDNGNVNTIGTNNIIIGRNISLPNAFTNGINIGGILFGTGTNAITGLNPVITPVIGGKIGIGVIPTTSTFEVAGTGSFTGTVKGSNAINANEFATKGQMDAQSVIEGVDVSGRLAYRLRGIGALAGGAGSINLSSAPVSQAVGENSVIIGVGAADATSSIKANGNNSVIIGGNAGQGGTLSTTGNGILLGGNVYAGGKISSNGTTIKLDAANSNVTNNGTIIASSISQGTHTFESATSIFSSYLTSPSFEFNLRPNILLGVRFDRGAIKLGKGTNEDSESNATMIGGYYHASISDMSTNITSNGRGNVIIGGFEQTSSTNKTINKFAYGNGSVLLGGTGLQSNTHAAVTMGVYNDPIITTKRNSYVATDPIFIIGNGTSDVARSNSYVMHGNGNSLQIGTATAKQFNVSNLNEAPTSATDTGTIGEIRITADYIYICVGANEWKRTALSTW